MNRMENMIVENYEEFDASSRTGWSEKNTDDILQMEINTDQGKQSLYSTNPAEIGKFINITFTYNGSEAKIFINGENNTNLFNSNGEILGIRTELSQSE